MSTTVESVATWRVLRQEGLEAALLDRHFRDVRAALINGTSSVVPLAVLSELSRTALPELLGNDDAIYADLMRREAALSREHGLPHGHVACAPLSRARAARAALVTALGRRVLYSSKTHDAVCWTAALTADDAEALRADGFFFHVALLPGPAKLAPATLWVSPYKASWGQQFTALLWRNLLAVLKDPLVARVRCIQCVVLGLILGTRLWCKSLA